MWSEKNELPGPAATEQGSVGTAKSTLEVRCITCACDICLLIGEECYNKDK